MNRYHSCCPKCDCPTPEDALIMRKLDGRLYFYLGNKGITEREYLALRETRKP